MLHWSESWQPLKEGNKKIYFFHLNYVPDSANWRKRNLFLSIWATFQILLDEKQRHQPQNGDEIQPQFIGSPRVFSKLDVLKLDVRLENFSNNYKVALWGGRILYSYTFHHLLQMMLSLMGRKLEVALMSVTFIYILFAGSSEDAEWSLSHKYWMLNM